MTSLPASVVGGTLAAAIVFMIIFDLVKAPLFAPLGFA